MRIFHVMRFTGARTALQDSAGNDNYVEMLSP